MPRLLLPLLLTLLTALPTWAESFVGRVVGVSDGDTITVLEGRVQNKVRLFGIDAPERSQPFGTRAKQFISDKVFAKTVTVKVKTKDRYGRFVARVTLPDGADLSSEAVKNGFAWWYRKYAPNDRELETLERTAKSLRQGLWVDPNPIPPWEFRHGGGGVVSDSNVPSTSEIIGNRNSKLYHLKHCPGFTTTAPKNRVPFESVEAAERGGYRRAKNCE